MESFEVEFDPIGSTSWSVVSCYCRTLPSSTPHVPMSLNPHPWLKPALKLRLAHIHTKRSHVLCITRVTLTYTNMITHAHKHNTCCLLFSYTAPE